MTEKIVILSDRQPVAQGSSRWVYEHPENPGWLIKVLKKGIQPQQVFGLRQRIKALKGRHKLARNMREIEQYITVVSNKSDEFAKHLPAMTELIKTDVGFGFVVEAIHDKDGKLAPTLRQLLEQNEMNVRRITLLEVFFDRLLESDVVAGDVHSKNIVLETRSNGEERFVLIDGLGDSTIIPTRAMSWIINQGKRMKTLMLQGL